MNEARGGTFVAVGQRCRCCTGYRPVFGLVLEPSTFVGRSNVAQVVDELVAYARDGGPPLIAYRAFAGEFVEVEA